VTAQGGQAYRSYLQVAGRAIRTPSQHPAIDGNVDRGRRAAAFENGRTRQRSPTRPAGSVSPRLVSATNTQITWPCPVPSRQVGSVWPPFVLAENARRAGAMCVKRPDVTAWSHPSDPSRSSLTSRLCSPVKSKITVGMAPLQSGLPRSAVENVHVRNVRPASVSLRGQPTQRSSLGPTACV
jgi:hypothetical protein